MISDTALNRLWLRLLDKHPAERKTTAEYKEEEALRRLDARAAELDRIRFLGKEKPETCTSASGYVFPDW